MKRHLFRNTAAALIAALGLTVAAPAPAQTQGVSANEIVLGTIQDLSGPIAAYGKQLRNGMQMRADEINAAGGVRGRKIRLVVEDSGYDPKRALLAAQKLVGSDRIFAMVNHLGTAGNLAALPIQTESNVINFLPMSGSREMFDPPHRLKFAILPPYYDVMRVIVPQLVREKGFKTVGVIYQDDEAGLEMLRGVEAGMKSINMTIAEKTSFKRGATDFSSQVAKLKAAGCDLVALGTVIRETVGTMAEARKTGFNPAFVGSSAVYTHLVHVLGGKAVEGLYAAQTVDHPYGDEGPAPVLDWITRYKAKFGEDPTAASIISYLSLDWFAKAADKAGANLTTDSFIAAMESLKFPPDMFGGPEVHFTRTNRLGANDVRLAQIQNGRWRSVSRYFEIRPE